MISKDFILVKFEYIDYRGYRKEQHDKSKYWTVMNINGHIKRMTFNIPSDMSIIHTSKHRQCTLIIMKSQEEKEENEEEND